MSGGPQWVNTGSGQEQGGESTPEEIFERSRLIDEQRAMEKKAMVETKRDICQSYINRITELEGQIEFLERQMGEKAVAVQQEVAKVRALAEKVRQGAAATAAVAVEEDEKRRPTRGTVQDAYYVDQRLQDPYRGRGGSGSSA